jgi:uracil-DNA glycosylase
MDEDRLKRQVTEQYLAQIARGVQRFPPPHSASEAALEVEQLPSEIASPAHRLPSELKCEKCPLKSSRTQLVAEPSFSPRKYMALLDFPDAAEQDSPELFRNEKLASHIAMRLLMRLGIQEQTHKSFALKCVPKNGIPNGALKSCHDPLQFELERVAPQVLFCFGLRALLSLATLYGFQLEQSVEIGELIHTKLPFRVFCLPSVRELESFPEWRAAVWHALQEFRT